MSRTNEIVAALADVSSIDGYETLRAEMVDWFSDQSERMRAWEDKRPSQIMCKMVATIDTVPYDMLVEFGHSYNSTLLSYAMLLRCCDHEMPDYADAYALVQTMLDDLRYMASDHPDAQNALHGMDALFKDLRRRYK
jgi:hypothetical protein